MQSLSSLLHPAGEERAFWTALAKLCDQEPRPWSFEVWDSILQLARDKGLTAQTQRGVDRNGEPIRSWVGHWGPAFLERYRWLVDARARGLTPRQAEAEFCGRVDRERAAERRREEARRTASASKAPFKRGQEVEL